MQLQAAIVLAAGKGTRLNNGDPSTKPKVMYEIAGRPMISYTRDLLLKLNIPQIVFVVGYQYQVVENYLGQSFDYAFQEEQLGTGHALKLGLEKIKSANGYLLVLQGDDSSFYKPETILDFIEKVATVRAPVGLITSIQDDPGSLGRVIRDDDGYVEAIIEKAELTPEQENLKEINCGTYLFNLQWLSDNINRLIKHEPKGEYFLPDLIKIAIDEKEKVLAYTLENPQEWMGVNTPEQLEIADALKKASL